MTKTVLIVCTLLCSSLFGQVQQQTDSLGTVSIVTEPPGADLFVDSLFVGKSPLERISVQRGTHHIKAFYPSVFAWNAVVAQETLEVSGVERLEKRLSIGGVLRVQSDPPGGNVIYRGSTLGATPLFLHSKSPLLGNLMIQKDGFDSLQIPVSKIRSGFIRVQLRPKEGNGGLLNLGDLRGMGVKAADHWLTYASGATMIVSGVASAYMKDQANREFDRYLLSKDPASLSSTRRLDRGAAISLVISQISFAILSYLLLSE